MSTNPTSPTSHTVAVSAHHLMVADLAATTVGNRDLAQRGHVPLLPAGRGSRARPRGPGRAAPSRVLSADGLDFGKPFRLNEEDRNGRNPV